MTRQAAHRAQCVKSPIDLDASLAAGSSGRDSEGVAAVCDESCATATMGPGVRKEHFLREQ